MSGVDYIKRIIGKGGDRIILDVEKSALTLVYGKDGKPCEVDCQTKRLNINKNPQIQHSQRKWNIWKSVT